MAQIGMNRLTGKPLRGEEHLTQSLQVLLSTPIGSRVMLAGYGSDVTELIDSPMTDSDQLRIQKSIIDAITQWEPRFIVDQITAVSKDIDGELTISITGRFNGDNLSFEALRLVPSTATPVIPEPVEPLEPSAYLFSFNGQFFSINNKFFGVAA